MQPASGDIGAVAAYSEPPLVVAIAASAGGLAALDVLFNALDRATPAAFLVVQHLAPDHPSLLSDILARHCTLRVKNAEQGELIRGGVIYLAVPSRHLLVGADRTIRLSDDPPVHFVRPAADLLFASAADAFGARVAAVILSGTGSDGAAGARAVKRRGGTVIVQSESSSEFSGMPAATIATGVADLILPLREIAPTLQRMAPDARLR
jgi:two-component system chemotaxis response regulator CheB